MYQLWSDFKRFRWHDMASSCDPYITSEVRRHVFSFLPVKVQKWLTSNFRGYFPRFGSTEMAKLCSDCPGAKSMKSGCENFEALNLPAALIFPYLTANNSLEMSCPLNLKLTWSLDHR
jgi:hypothetical protein